MKQQQKDTKKRENRRTTVEEGGKKDGRWTRSKIKSREWCWVGGRRMTGKGAEHERFSKIEIMPTCILGRRNYIEMTLI